MTPMPIPCGQGALPPVTAAPLRGPALPVGPGPAPCGPRAVAPGSTRRPGPETGTSRRTGAGADRAAGAPAVRQHGAAQPQKRRASGVPEGGSPRPARPATQPSDRRKP